MRLITIAKAADEIDLSERTIHRLITEGRLTKYQLAGGRAVRVDMDEIHGLFAPERPPQKTRTASAAQAESSRPKGVTAWDQRRKDTVDYLREYTQEHGKTPSLFAIADRFGLGVGAVQARMRDLHNRGFIRIDSPMSIKNFECTVLEGEPR